MLIAYHGSEIILSYSVVMPRLDDHSPRNQMKNSKWPKLVLESGTNFDKWLASLRSAVGTVGARKKLVLKTKTKDPSAEPRPRKLKVPKMTIEVEIEDEVVKELAKKFSSPAKGVEAEAVKAEAYVDTPAGKEQTELIINGRCKAHEERHGSAMSASARKRFKKQIRKLIDQTAEAEKAPVGRVPPKTRTAPNPKYASDKGMMRE